ncbi:hypothetical protein J6590_040510 [Homalodisca vitripennis]|nr:hypothetical protein J6590_040510 [Homalodisca vitripennis]
MQRILQGARITDTTWPVHASELNLCECPFRSWPLWVTIGVLSGRKEPACTTPSGPGCFDRSARQATMRGPLYCAVLKLNLYPVVVGSLILSVLMAHWPVRGSYQTEQGGESIQYKTTRLSALPKIKSVFCGDEAQNMEPPHRFSRGIHSPAALRSLYYSLIRPLAKYASPLWSPYTIRSQMRLEALQRRFIRLVGVRLGYGYLDVPVDDIARGHYLLSLA